MKTEEEIQAKVVKLQEAIEELSGSCDHHLVEHLDSLKAELKALLWVLGYDEG